MLFGSTVFALAQTFIVNRGSSMYGDIYGTSFILIDIIITEDYWDGSDGIRWGEQSHHLELYLQRKKRSRSPFAMS